MGKKSVAEEVLNFGVGDSVNIKALQGWLCCQHDLLISGEDLIRNIKAEIADCYWFPYSLADSGLQNYRQMIQNQDMERGI